MFIDKRNERLSTSICFMARTLPNIPVSHYIIMHAAVTPLLMLEARLTSYPHPLTLRDSTRDTSSSSSQIQYPLPTKLFRKLFFRSEGSLLFLFQLKFTFQWLLLYTFSQSNVTVVDINTTKVGEQQDRQDGQEATNEYKRIRADAHTYEPALVSQTDRKGMVNCMTQNGKPLLLLSRLPSTRIIYA